MRTEDLFFDFLVIFTYSSFFSGEKKKKFNFFMFNKKQVLSPHSSLLISLYNKRNGRRVNKISHTLLGSFAKRTIPKRNRFSFFHLYKQWCGGWRVMKISILVWVEGGGWKIFK